MNRSMRRRWMQGEGNEWIYLSAASQITAAYHLTRLCADALPGGPDGEAMLSESGIHVPVVNAHVMGHTPGLPRVPHHQD